MVTCRSAATCISSPMITNSVVPMPNAPMVSAYSASGVRGRATGTGEAVDMAAAGREGSAQARPLRYLQKPSLSTISFNSLLIAMDRIDDIALFLRVLDLGSISAAARSLDLSVAVASQRLKRLEKQLGVRLL